ncbi:unnamed protein product [Phyllotreta striolata]|uniref:Phosphatidic acid phosphatase type 2/haloperoxidase domain-containing protein n=1 Tax=Phyllotreta striolata TaxID=444603 RepID=A0A9N9TJT1_PHYSR|nr:unnamed protein product [Phyllotreta striolata]
MDRERTHVHLVIEAAFRIGMWTCTTWLDAKMPYVRHIDEDELWYYRYPSLDSFFPKLYVYCLIVLFPCLVFLVELATMKTKTTTPTIVTSCYALSLAYCLTHLFVAALKVTVGKPRPNFYLRCFPEGYGTDIDMCDGEYHGQMDGRKSFPSAHSAFAFCCMVYMAIYIMRMVDLRKPKFMKGFLITGLGLMFLTASLIAVSRTMDYHNNYSDVIAGALIGSFFAIVCDYFYSLPDERMQINIKRIVKETLDEEEVNRQFSLIDNIKPVADPDAADEAPAIPEAD